MPLCHLPELVLASGRVLENVEIAYESYGEMAAGRDNVILVAHGATSSHVAAGVPTLDRRRGWYSELIGPGKLLDTSRCCVISSNALGSCYGSTGPASRNPANGTRYGRAFPEICHEDMVRAQHELLRSLGVERLVAVAGSSIGGFQALQWAVTYPDFASAILALDTSLRDPFNIAASIPDLIAKFATDANWNDGNYAQGSMTETLTNMRIETLRSYGFEEKIDVPDKTRRDAILFQTARDWAREFDAHSLVTLMGAWGSFNVQDELEKISAPVFYVLCDTDQWFPASLGKDVMAKLHEAGVDAEYHEVHSRLGHFATTEEPEKWVAAAEAFLDRASHL